VAGDGAVPGGGFKKDAVVELIGSTAAMKHARNMFIAGRAYTSHRRRDSSRLPVLRTTILNGNQGPAFEFFAD